MIHRSLKLINFFWLTQAIPLSSAAVIRCPSFLSPTCNQKLGSLLQNYCCLFSSSETFIATCYKVRLLASECTTPSGNSRFFMGGKRIWLSVDKVRGSGYYGWVIILSICLLLFQNFGQHLVIKQNRGKTYPLLLFQDIWIAFIPIAYGSGRQLM